MKKKILILTVKFGDGHFTAAQNIRAALKAVAEDELNGDKLDIEIIDVYGLCSKLAYRIEQKIYLALINRTPRLWGKIFWLSHRTRALEYLLWTRAPARRKLAEVLDRERPDAIVVTYWMYNYLLSNLQPRRPKTEYSHITVITDVATIHSAWWRGGSDFFLVADQTTSGVLRQAGVAAEKICATGFPISPRFAILAASTKRAAPSSQTGRRVLYVVNSGKKRAPAVVEELIRCAGIELTVVVGRNTKLLRTIEAATQDANIPVRVLGWREDMPELLMNHHVLISKSGPGMIQEAIAARCPIIISQTVPGQEAGSTRLVVESDCGAVVETPAQIAKTVTRLFENEAALWHRWHDNISRLSQPDSALKIARFILDHTN